jgi:hypothetical protein
MVTIPEIDPWANESKATLRYLSKRSGQSEGDSLAALRAANGNIPNALRRLNPALTVFKFPEWYYVGPFKMANDPDRDLPIREWDYTGSFEWDIDNDRTVQGQRLIAPFNDSNSLSDVLGCIGYAGGYPEFGLPELKAIGSLQANLARAADRIREKLRRNRNPSRATFFENAIRFVEVAKDVYFDRDYQKGRETLFQAERQLREGNEPRKKGPETT